MSDESSTVLETAQAAETASPAVQAPVAPQTPATGQQTASTPAQNGDIRSWLDDKGQFKPGWAKGMGLPETFGKFTQPEAAFKSYAALERAWGNPNKVAIPGPNSTAEERSAYQKAIGVPDKAEDYKFAKPDKIGEKNVPDMLWDKEQISDFAKLAKERGLTKEQADAILQFDLARGMKAIDKIGGDQAQALASGKAALKTEFGADYDSKLASAARAAKMFGGEELVNHPALGNDPILIKALAKIGEATAERQSPGMRQSAGEQGPANPRAEARRIQADVKDAYHHKNHPDHANRVAYVQSLYEQAQPPKQ